MKYRSLTSGNRLGSAIPLLGGLLAGVLPAPRPLLAQDLNPAFVTSWPGRPQSVAQGVSTTYFTYVVVALGDAGIAIVDIYTLRPYTRLGGLDTPGYAHAVAVAGDLAYVADGAAGLHIISLTNVATPVLLGTYRTAAPALHVAITGTTAYVAEGTSGVEAISVANPSAPTRLGMVDTPGSAVAVALVGDRVYVADTAGGLRIHRGVPSSMNLLGAFATGGDVTGVALNGYTVYLASGAAGFVVVDTTFPASSTELHRLALPGPARSVSVSSGTAHVACGTNGVALVNVTTETNLVLAAVYDTPGTAAHAAATPSFSYIADGENGLVILRTTVPSAPSLLGNVNLNRSATSVRVAGSQAVLAQGVWGFNVLDLQHPDFPQPQELVTHDTPGAATGLATVGELLCVADGTNGLQVFTMTNPAAPIRLGGYDTPGTANAVAVSGTLAYVADGLAGLQVIDISTPTNPVRLGGFDTPGNAMRVTVAGDLVYVADYFGGMHILSVTNPASPAWLGGYYGAFVYDIALRGPHAYLAASGAGLHIVDISNPTNVTLVGSVGSVGTGYSVALADQYAYLATLNTGVQVLDVSNPAAPVRVGGYDTPGSAQDLAVSDHFLYVADGPWGLTVLRLVGTNHMPATILAQPASLIVHEGGAAAFAVAAEGRPPLHYQWRFNGEPLAGETSTSLGLADVQFAQAGAYTVTVTNSLGSVTSQVASLTVLPTNSSLGWLAFADTSSGGNWKGVYGSAGHWLAGLSTNLPPGVQVAFDQGALTVFSGDTSAFSALERPGTNSVTNRFAAAQARAGAFEVTVSLPFGVTNRLAAYFMELTGNRAQRVELVDTNTGTVLDTRALGSLSNGVHLVWDVTGPVALRCTPLSGPDAVLSGLFFGTVAGEAPVVRVAPPASQRRAAGEPLVLGAGANGSPALGFRWLQDGAPLTDSAARRGAGAAVLAINGLTPADAGVYSLIVSNALGQAFGATSVVAVAGSVPEKASFVFSDTTTKGNWNGVYGTTGHLLFGLSTNLPPEAPFAVTAGEPFTFAASTTDPVALERPGSNSVFDRYSGCIFSGASVELALPLPAGVTNRLAFYFHEPTSARTQRFELLDETGLKILDDRTFTGLTNGIYLVYDVNGLVRARLTPVVGGNAVLSGVFLGAATNQPPALRVQPVAQTIVSVGQRLQLGVGASGSPALAFEWRKDSQPLTGAPGRSGVTTPILTINAAALGDSGSYTARVTNSAGQTSSQAGVVTVVSPNPARARHLFTDVTTGGNWKNVYGTQGHLIFGHSTNLPVGISLDLTNGDYFAFSQFTANPAALERTDTTDPVPRYSAVMFAPDTLTLVAALPADQTNRLAFYFQEPGGTRTQRVDLLDPETGLVLDSRLVSAFTNGAYLAWDLSGPVIVRIHRAAGANVVLNAAFLGLPIGQPPVVRVPPPASLVLGAGASTGLLTSFDGMPPLSYRWRKDGMPLSDGPGREGSFRPLLSLSNLQGGDSGYYDLFVLGGAGQTLTAPVALAVVVPDPAKGRFISQDGTTMGNWPGVYGSDAHLVFGLTTNLPSGADLSLSGGQYFLINGFSTDPVALEKPGAPPTNRFSAVMFTPTNMTLAATLPPGVTNRLALYFADTGGTRTQRVDLLDAATGFVLDTRTVTTPTNGVYLSWDVNGPVQARITRLGGANAVLSAAFVGTPVGQAPVVRAQPPEQATVQAGAPFVIGVGASGSPGLGFQWRKDGSPLPNGPTLKGATTPVLNVSAAHPSDMGDYTALVVNGAGQAVSQPTMVTVVSPDASKGRLVVADATTGGNWKGVYGVAGHVIYGLSSNLPAEVGLNLSGGVFALHSADTPDPFGLERTDSVWPTNRFAAAMTSAISLTVEAALPGGVTNRVALYFLDPAGARAQRVDLVDIHTGLVLDSRVVTAPTNGLYLVYDVNGAVRWRVTRLTGADAALSAIFLGAAQDQPPVTRVAPPHGPAVEVGGSVILSASFSGSGPLTYQWRKGGAPLADGPGRKGTKTPILTLSNIELADAGSYTLQAVNAGGQVTTPAAALVVFEAQPVRARFLGADGTTLGNWKGVYGTDGHMLIGYSTNLPPGVQATFDGGGYYTFFQSTSEPNCLEKPDLANVLSRFSGVQFSSTAVLLDLDLPADTTNRVAFYLMEPGVTRVQRFELLDPANTQLLHSRTVSALSNAVYLVYDLNGPVRVRVTPLAGGNAVLNALFFGSVTGQAPGVRVQPPATINGALGGNIVFGVGASGSPALTYQWFKGGFAITDTDRRVGARKPVLRLTALEASDVGRYSLVIANAEGATASQATLVNIPGVALPFSLSPPVVVGGTVTFNVLGQPGVPYVLEGSTNLTGWQAFLTNQSANGIVPVSDPLGRFRFYRALRP